MCCCPPITVPFVCALGQTTELATVGTWVYPATNSIHDFNFTALSGGGQKGSTSCGGGGGPGNKGARDACSRYVFVGQHQPDDVTFPPAAPPPPPAAPCSIAGKWIQDQTGDTFGPFTETGGSSP